MIYTTSFRKLSDLIIHKWHHSMFQTKIGSGGQEITLMEVKEPEEDGEPIWLMNETEISKIILAKDQKLIYVFDFLLMWCFYVDVIAIKEVEDIVILPRITQEFGEAPDQYSKSDDIVFDGVEISNDDEDIEENELDELFRMMGNEDL